MKRILFHSNCCCVGLTYFLKMCPDLKDSQFRSVQNYQLILKEITPEYELESLEWADLIFYHRLGGNIPWSHLSANVTAKTQIALAVPYNGGAFMRNAAPESWEPIIAMARMQGPEVAANYAVHCHDFDFENRWNENWEKMKRKEIDEGVDPSMWISDLIPEGREFQLFMTMNHPTSLLFMKWANRILTFLGLQQLSGLECLCLAQPNLANLPCEDFASAAARRILGLQWGGDERSNNECWRLAHETIEKRLREAA